MGQIGVESRNRGMAVVLAAVALGLCLGAAARAETETEREIRDLKERIDELEQVKEREVRDLKERIDKLEQVKEKAKQAKEEIEKEIAGVESEAAEAKAEAGQALAKAVDLIVETNRMKHAGHNFTIAKTGTIITLSGFVKTDLIHDFQAINTPAKFTTSAIVVPGQGNGQTTFSANPSRLLFASATPTRIGQVRAPMTRACSSARSSNSDRRPVGCARVVTIARFGRSGGRVPAVFFEQWEEQSKDAA